MKYIHKIILASVALVAMPLVSFATISVGWSAPSSGYEYITPNAVNGHVDPIGVPYALMSSTTASSTFLGGAYFANTSWFNGGESSIGQEPPNDNDNLNTMLRVDVPSSIGFINAGSGDPFTLISATDPTLTLPGSIRGIYTAPLSYGFFGGENAYGVYSAPFLNNSESHFGSQNSYAFYGNPQGTNDGGGVLTKYGDYMTGEDYDYYSGKVEIGTDSPFTDANGNVSQLTVQGESQQDPVQGTPITFSVGGDPSGTSGTSGATEIDFTSNGGNAVAQSTNDFGGGDPYYQLTSFDGGTPQSPGTTLADLILGVRHTTGTSFLQGLMGLDIEQSGGGQGLLTGGHISVNEGEGVAGTSLVDVNGDVNVTTGHCYRINEICQTFGGGGSSFAYPFTPSTNYGSTNQATTGIAWFQNGLNASSTSRFVNASTTALTVGTLTGILQGISGAVSASSSVSVAYGGTGSTTLSGILKGGATGPVQSAVGDTDYQRPITLTTTGSSGAATFSNDTLNIPQYSPGASSAYPFPLSVNATSTLTQFNGGLTAYASSTIGNGISGLTMSGNATGTGMYLAATLNVGTTTKGLGTVMINGNEVFQSSTGLPDSNNSAAGPVLSTGYYSTGDYGYITAVDSTRTMKPLLLDTQQNGNAGFVGIGTVSPQDPLDIYGGGNIFVGHFKNASHVATVFAVENSTSNHQWEFSTAGDQISSTFAGVPNDGPYYAFQTGFGTANGVPFYTDATSTAFKWMTNYSGMLNMSNTGSTAGPEQLRIIGNTSQGSNDLMQITDASNNRIFTASSTAGITEATTTVTGFLQAGSSATGLTNFPNTKAVFLHDDLGGALVSSQNIGGLGEAKSSGGSNIGRGLYGIGVTSGSGIGQGFFGYATTSASGDTGDAVGAWGQSISTHSGGINYGMEGVASGSGVENDAVAGFATAPGNVTPSFLTAGVKGVGTGNGTSQATGVFGIALPTLSSDTAAVYGGRFQSTTAHSGGINYGVYSDASGGSSNYSFYGNTGILYNAGNAGFGSTSPSAQLSVQSNSGTVDVVSYATSTGASVGGIDGDGHAYTAGPAPVISTCGTGAGTVVGDDQGGTITTATAATSCTATFAHVFQRTPFCTVTDDSLVGFADISSISASSVTFGISSALTGGHLYYQCSYHR